MDFSKIPSELLAVAGASAAGGAGAWHLVRPLAQPYIDKALGAVPAWLAARARADFAAALASGKIPPPAVRLLQKLEAAALDWAQDEIEGDSDAAQAAGIVAALSLVPGLGKLIAADPEETAHDVTVELAAVKAALAAAKKTPPPPPPAPVASPAPAPASPPPAS